MIRFLFVFIFNISSLFAIVDIAAVDFKEKPEGLSGSVHGSFQKKRGNTEKDEAEYGGRIQYDTNKTITWLQGIVEHDEAAGITTDDNSFLHLRHIHQLFNPRWATELYFQLKQDKFRNLQQREVIGLGIRYKLFDAKDYGELFLGLSAMNEDIRYNAIDPNEHNKRFSSYVSYNLPVNDTFELSWLSYYQPMMDHSSDYLFSSIAEMTVHLTEVLDLSYVIEFDYDSCPPSWVNTTDSRQKLSFVYRFGKKDPVTSYVDTLLASKTLPKTVETKKHKGIFGLWKKNQESLEFLSDGKGLYQQKDGLYNGTFSWEVVGSGSQVESIVINFKDAENRVIAKEYYLFQDNHLIGLEKSGVKQFMR